MKRAHFKPRLATRLPWMIFAPVEFAVTVLVGVFLYLGAALYFAAYTYVTALGGLFDRAVALARHRFRVGPIFSGGYVKEMSAAPPGSRKSPRSVP